MNISPSVVAAVVVSRMLIAWNDFRDAPHVTATDVQNLSMLSTTFAPVNVMATSPKWSAL